MEYIHYETEFYPLYKEVCKSYEHAIKVISPSAIRYTNLCSLRKSHTRTLNLQNRYIKRSPFFSLPNDLLYQRINCVFDLNWPVPYLLTTLSFIKEFCF